MALLSHSTCIYVFPILTVVGKYIANTKQLKFLIMDNACSGGLYDTSMIPYQNMAMVVPW